MELEGRAESCQARVTTSLAGCLPRLGGYLDRTSDPPPGTTVIWRGFSRLADLVEGARIATPPPDTYG